MPKHRLIIMRHATAVGGGVGTDAQRALTKNGRSEAEQIGRRLSSLGAVPDRVLSSSAIRCRETYDALCKGLDTEPSVDFLDALYNAAPETLLDELAAADKATGGVGDMISSAEAEHTLLLLAHNPGVSMLAYELGTGNPRDEAELRPGFSPASFAIFEIIPADGTRSGRKTRLVHMERPT